MHGRTCIPYRSQIVIIDAAPRRRTPHDNNNSYRASEVNSLRAASIRRGTLLINLYPSPTSSRNRFSMATRPFGWCSALPHPSPHLGGTEDERTLRIRTVRYGTCVVGDGPVARQEDAGMDAGDRNRLAIRRRAIRHVASASR